MSKIKRRSFIKGALGALAAPGALKAGVSDVSVLKARNVPKEIKRRSFQVPDQFDEFICTTSTFCSRSPLLTVDEENVIEALAGLSK